MGGNSTLEAPSGTTEETSYGPLLAVFPSQLDYKIVPDAYSTKQIRLENTTAQPVAFKVKTTNPKNYFVRPNQGIIRPHEKLAIHAMMGKQSAVPTQRCKDRFLVQS